MKKQSEIFGEGGEGDSWFLRNRHSLGSKVDPLISYFRQVGRNLGAVAEVGCANGWRLAEMSKIGLCSLNNCYGIDPSAAAIDNGKTNWPEMNLTIGSADCIPFDAGSIDTLIFGFCLYLVDPDDLFKVAYEANRVLSVGGRIVIYDFMSSGYYKNNYSHRDGLFSHKMDFSKMVSWHPNYVLEAALSISHSSPEKHEIPANLDDWTAITVLKKIR
jgi:ubiquinone/menaquinone biosynthesis C-methylase UbiE